MAYFSNGSEGEVLDNQCCECRLPFDAPCPVLLAQITYNYDQFKDGKETEITKLLNILVDEDGVCQMKPLLDKLPDRRANP